MDFTSVIGVVAGFGLIIWAIMQGGDIFGFVDLSSVLITVGGTLSATIASFPLKAFLGMGKHFKIILRKEKHLPEYYIKILVEMAFEARKNGILSLEDKAANLKDKFLSDSVLLIVDALESEKIKELLQNEFDNLESRHSAVWKLYEKAATFAPAFGMIGTLIGLVNMLANLSSDSQNGMQSLTSGMAVALLTTLYGSMLANLVFMPMANKLRSRHEEEMLCKEIIAQGVISIQAGDNPRFVEQKLNTFLNNKKNSKNKDKQEKAEKKGKNKGAENETEQG